MSTRPSWRADLKWVCAIICLLSILIACVAYSARALTSHDTATGIFTAAVGGFASSQLDDAEWESIEADASADLDGTLAIPGIRPEVTGAEIAGLSKEEAVFVAMGPVADTNYEEGSDAAVKLLDLQDEDGGEFSLGPLGSLTKESHDGLQPFLIWSMVVAALSATALFGFARGPGRAGAVAAVTALATVAFALVWMLADNMASGVKPQDGAFAHELGQSVAPAASDLASTFLTIFLLTLAISAASIVAHFGESPARKAWARYGPARAKETAVSTETDEEPEAEATPEPAPPRPSLGARRRLRPS